MKFQVFENGKPCDNVGFPTLHAEYGWGNSKFETFEAAQEYAKHWLGDWKGIVPSMKVNVPIDYDGYGDTIEIRKL